MSSLAAFFPVSEVQKACEGLENGENPKFNCKFSVNKNCEASFSERKNKINIIKILENK